MWLSKKIGEGEKKTGAESAKVTLNSGDEFESNGSVKTRNVAAYAPFGYSCATPVGEEVLLVDSSEGSAALGAKMNIENLKSGEIRIASAGGACIVLKNDGSVVINSLVIDSNGAIIQ